MNECTKFVIAEMTKFVISNINSGLICQIALIHTQNKEKQQSFELLRFLSIISQQTSALKAGEPSLFRLGSNSEGQLKERSEGGQAQ